MSCKLSRLVLFLSVSIVAALVLLALPLPRAAAQSTGQGKIEGQLVEGTHDAQLSGTNGLSVTLHMAPANATSTVTQTAPIDGAGRFAFAGLDTISTTRYLLIANYQGVDYFSDVLNFGANQTTLPISLTVYETTTDAAAIQVKQTHLVFDVQTKEFNVLQIVAVTNSTDRTYVGATPGAGPHRVTLPLPFLPGAQNIEFDNPAANDSTLRGSEQMSYTLPFTPGDDQIVYNYTLPFNPPTYQMNLKLPFDTDQFRVLLSDVGGTIQSTQLSAPTSFPTQGGTNFILTSATNLKAGTSVAATFSNLPANVSQPAAPGSNPTTAPVAANSNLQLIGGVVLGVAALAAIGLLLYPVLRRRQRRSSPSETLAPAAPAASRRLDLLQEMADLDDDFEAQKISEVDYRERRAQLKAELLTLPKGNAEGAGGSTGAE